MMRAPAPNADAATELARVASRSVVQVEDGGRGSGAGVVVGQPGVIVTNAHVVRGESPAIVTHDGMRLDGRLEARDDELDLAAIRIAGGDLQPIQDGDARRLSAGQIVIAVGHPLGLRDAVTVGVVNRIVLERGRRELIASNITLDRGNSGGPLLDSSGRLVGINTMVAGTRLGISIPVHVVMRFLARHVDPRPHIGVTVQQVDAHSIIIDVHPDSPAEAAGLIPGDIVVTVNGCSADDTNSLLDGLVATGIGSTVELNISRAGEPIRICPKVIARA